MAHTSQYLAQTFPIECGLGFLLVFLPSFSCASGMRSLSFFLYKCKRLDLMTSEMGNF